MIWVSTNNPSGRSVPKMICIRICDVKSLVLTMKSRLLNDSSASYMRWTRSNISSEKSMMNA